MIRTFVAISALLLVPAASMAQEVKPGNAPTKAVGAAVPEMKTECPDDAKVDTKAPGTEATEAVGKAVPEMKGDAKADCPPKAGAQPTK